MKFQFSIFRYISIFSFFVCVCVVRLQYVCRLRIRVTQRINDTPTVPFASCHIRIRNNLKELCTTRIQFIYRNEQNSKLSVLRQINNSLECRCHEPTNGDGDYTYLYQKTNIKLLSHKIQITPISFCSSMQTQTHYVVQT